MFFFRSCIFRCSLWAVVFASLFVIAIVNVSAQESRSIEVNPGNLGARIYVPLNLGAGRPLVVALHGCGQTAEDYDNETGWTALADEMKFVLLLPEQQIANNPARCFNWFVPEDIKRGHGEGESIKQMVEAAIQHHGVDAKRVYVTGLSAGGSMTAVMLASYPDVFAGGAILSGVPYGCVHSDLLWSVEGPACMQIGDPSANPAEWGNRVREAAANLPQPIPWPLVSIWHGERDKFVRIVNQQDSMEQWTNVHRIDQQADRVEQLGSARHESYSDGGKELVEVWTIADMGHAVAIDPSNGCGTAKPFVEDKHICSSRKIAHFWGLDQSH